MLKQLSSNKSPGEDGIPYDFYEQFWDDVAPLFIEMFVSVLKNLRVSRSQSVGLVHLIPKCKQLKKSTDYWPITLLNCDYNIMVGVLVVRLKNTLPAVPNVEVFRVDGSVTT